MRSKVGTSMLSVIWFAASLILARPQVARSSSSGTLDEGDIIPRSKTRPDKDVDCWIKCEAISNDFYILTWELWDCLFTHCCHLMHESKIKQFCEPLAVPVLVSASNICQALLVLMCDCFTGTFCGWQPLNVTSSNHKAQTLPTAATDTKHGWWSKTSWSFLFCPDLLPIFFWGSRYASALLSNFSFLLLSVIDFSWKISPLSLFHGCKLVIWGHIGSSLICTADFSWATIARLPPGLVTPPGYLSLEFHIVLFSTCFSSSPFESVITDPSEATRADTWLGW